MRGQNGSLPLALAAVLLGAACNQGMAPLAPPLVCSPAQVLSTDSHGQLVCVSAPQGAVSAPSCPTALTSDGQQLLCTTVDTAFEKDQLASAALQQVADTVHAIELRTQPAAPTPSYLGLSVNPTNAKIFASGITFSGEVAAAIICTNDWNRPGAHMCTMDELYQAVGDGTLKATDTIAPSWVYMPNWNMSNSQTPVVEPQRGVADNCGGYTGRSQSNHWDGILVEWGPLPDGTPGFRWHGGDDADCDSQHKIACCK